MISCGFNVYRTALVQQLFRRLTRFGVPRATLVVLVRCGGGDLVLPSEAAAPADLLLIDGDKQNGAAGEALDQLLVVKVIDGRGQPMAGQLVAFTLATEA